MSAGWPTYGGLVLLGEALVALRTVVSLHARVALLVPRQRACDVRPDRANSVTRTTSVCIIGGGGTAMERNRHNGFFLLLS